MAEINRQLNLKDKRTAEARIGVQLEQVLQELIRELAPFYEGKDLAIMIQKKLIEYCEADALAGMIRQTNDIRRES